jgi:putative phage-type endonuclease
MALAVPSRGSTAYTEERVASRPEWLALRKTGIGSSDCAAALDLDPYRSATELFLEKVGLIGEKDLSDNEAVQTGLDLEQYVAERYERKTGRTVHRVNATWRSRQHPFMIANIDRRIVGERKGLECKTVGFWASQQSEDWGDPEAGAFDAVPQRYFLQCAHSAIVAGWPEWDLLALVAGQRIMGPYTISPDDELRTAIIEGTFAFWQRVEQAREKLASGMPENQVVARYAPPVSRESDLKLRFPHSQRKPVEATSEIAALFDELLDYRKDAEKAESEIAERRLAICVYMGDRDELQYEGATLVTWREGKPRETFDSKRHAKEQADCHGEYAGVGSASRPFLVKEPK